MVRNELALKEDSYSTIENYLRALLLHPQPTKYYRITKKRKKKFFYLIKGPDVAKFIKSVEGLAETKPNTRDSIFNNAIALLKTKSVIWREETQTSNKVFASKLSRYVNAMASEVDVANLRANNPEAIERIVWCSAQQNFMCKNCLLLFGLHEFNEAAFHRCIPT
jgi:hypothetical protein